MWPLLLDMTHDESKRMLRRLELEAYSSLISAFRAQGDLTKEKKKILQDLQYYLSISTERHRAEVRRAINDEKLCTVADFISGPNTMSEWLIEGRRLIPLMPRLVPQTAFTTKANEAANIQAEKNASMPVPSLTGNKDLTASTSPTLPPTSNIATKVNRPTSPSSNVVVLPSGMSIHIKGGLNTEEEEETPERKRRRSHSAESLVSPSASTQTPRVSYTTTAPSPVTGVSPMKITISKSPRSQVTTTTTQSQKVILVSSGQSSPNVLQKSITVPVVKTTANITGTTKASIILSNTPGTSSGSIITTPSMVSVGSGGSVTTSTMTFLTPTVSIPRPRVKTFPRQRFPNVQQGVQKPGVVIPMGPHPVQPSPQNVQNIHIKSVSKGPSNVQIRQEGSMKIISAGGSGKILPKMSASGSGTGTPVVVVSGGSSLSSSSNVTMVTRPISSIGQSGAKILNITTQGGKIISTGTGRNPNVVTVNPKTLQLHAVKTQGGGKPNVIVVQKTQPRRSINTPTSGTSKTTTIKSSAFEKELVNFLQRQDSTKHIVVSTPSGTRTIERKVIVTTPGQLEATRQRIRMEAEAKNNNILADLIKAAGIQEGEGGSDVTINLDEATVAALTGSGQTVEHTSRVSTSQGLPNNEWFEYDDGNQAYTSQGIDSQTIQAIIDSQPSTSQDKPKVTVQRASSIDLSQLNVDQLSQQQFYTIEQAMRMLNQPDKSSDGVSILRLDSHEGDSSQSGEGETTVIQEEIPGAAIHVTNQNSQAELEQIAQRLNLQGELDPQTGIFYNTNSAADHTSTDNLTSQIVVSSGGKTFDLLSSSLEQAQINLDSYQFLEEDMLDKVTNESVGQSVPEVVEVSSTLHEVYKTSAREAIGQETVIVSSSNEGSHMGPMIRIKSSSSSSFIPIQEISKSSTINITTHQQPSTSVIHEAVLSQEEGIYTAEIIDDSNINQTIDSSYIASGTANEMPVIIESTSGDVEGEIVGLEDIGIVSNSSSGANSGVESGDSSSLDASIRLSKRKRRPPSSLEDSPTSQTIGWSKSCLWLIQRVSKYRGLSRDKGEMNAASWFVKPVDPNDAPDYYSIIKSPMDFGTIKRKLEIGSYTHYEDFHSDMLLVRDNCRTYNPPGSVVRRDCDEVFAFYMSEYEKLLEKWQKVQFPSPVSKKLKFESRSPVK